jgi:hypothetical protein
MAVTVSNLVQGPASLYVGELGADEPDDAEVSNAMEETSVSGEWDDVGGTQEGVTLELDQEYGELEVDQIVDIIERRLTKREFKVNTSLAEVTLENFLVVSNGGEITSGSGFKAYEPKMDNSANQPHYRALIFDGIAPAGLRRRVSARKVLNVASVGQEAQKDGQTLFPAEFSCHYIDTTTHPFRYVDEVPEE